MKNSPCRLLLLPAGFIASAAIARAHPGHDGHELTWDFSHLASQPLATFGCGVVLAAVVWAGVGVIRRQIELRAQSLRVSQRNGGK